MIIAYKNEADLFCYEKLKSIGFSKFDFSSIYLLLYFYIIFIILYISKYIIIF